MAALTQKAKDAEVRALAAMRDKTALNEEVDQLRQQVVQLQADNTKMAAAHSSALQASVASAASVQRTSSQTASAAVQVRTAIRGSRQITCETCTSLRMGLVS